MNKIFKQAFEKTAALRKDVALQPHQQRVLEKLKTTPALLLWHGLGSGKTLSAISAAGDEHADFLLPASLRTNLDKELKKFTKSHKIKGQSYTKYLKSEPAEKDMLVLDEAHRIGVPDTAISKLVMKRAPLYKKRLLLSGSPMRNHPYELAPLIKVLDPTANIPLNKKDFTHKFVQEIPVDPGFINRMKGVKPGVREVIKNEKLLKNILKGKVDYHTTGTEHYPTVEEHHVPVLMSEAQQQLYHKAQSSIPRSVSIKMEQNIPLSHSEKAHLNAFFNSMRQISNSVRTFGINQGTPKIHRALQDLHHELKKPGAKALVYSNYLESGINEYEHGLKNKKIPYVRFDGKLSDAKRRAAVEAFNSGKAPVLLVSGAGSEGLDLKGTSLVQVLEPHWNQARTDQVKGRAVRYKSHEHLPKEQRKVTIKNYYSTLPETFFGLHAAKTSVDQYLHQMGKDKTKLNQQFLKVLRESAI